jgi:hypothetical protein
VKGGSVPGNLKSGHGTSGRDGCEIMARCEECELVFVGEIVWGSIYIGSGIILTFLCSTLMGWGVAAACVASKGITIAMRHLMKEVL